MKKQIILICALILWCCLFSLAVNAKTDATIYTDFSGNEFNDSGTINSGTIIKTEITNDKNNSFWGVLIYSFYDENKLEGVEIGEEIVFTSDISAKSITYTVKNSYKNAATLKIMLWNKKEAKLIPTAEAVLAKKAYGAAGPSSQYKNFSEQPEDKLKEQMPVPFNINNYKMTSVAKCDFNDFDFNSYSEKGGNICGDFTQSYSAGLWSIEAQGGIDNSPCVVLKAEDEVLSSRFQLVFKGENARVGDWYCLKFKLKGENLTDLSAARPYIEFADDTKKTQGSIYGERANYKAANEDWVECSVVSSINPTDTNGDSEYFNLFANVFLNDKETGSIIYVDDISISKVVMEPMDTVLVTPNYKGFVYGDNNINDINLRIYINEYNGEYPVENLSLTAKLTDESGAVFSHLNEDTLSKEMELSFSSSVLPRGEGDYYLNTALIDKATSKEIYSQEWTIRKRAEGYRPKIYVDEYNRYIKDNVPKFPIFHYANGNIYEEYVNVIKGTAVDAFTVAGAYHTSYRTPRMQRVRNSMDEYNIGGLLECCGYVFSNLYTGLPATNVKKQSDIRMLLTTMLTNFKDDPRIWAYRVFDEQNAIYFGEELRWQNDIMASVDPDHPTMGVTDKLFDQRPGIFAKTTDIIGVDPYFCTGMENQDLSQVGKMVRGIKQLNPGRPVFTILQGFWNNPATTLRGPNQTEYRNMAWQAICEGITAIDSFSYTYIKEDPWDGKTYQQLWQEQLEVFSEIKAFEDVILSVQPAPYYEASGSGINMMAKRYNGKSYLFAVNTQNSQNTLKVKMENISGVSEYYTKESITPADDSFSFDMEPYGVAIFEIEQPEFLSPHAELIRFSVSGGAKSYAITALDEEYPIINVEQKTKSLSYKITASEGAQLYINDKKVQSEGTVDIQNLYSIKVKVVSEDGKHTTEKGYRIAR